MATGTETAVLVAHREPLIRAGLESALGKCSDLDVHCASEEQALQANDQKAIVADCEAGIRLALAGREAGPPVLIVTTDDSEVSIRRAIAAGVRGYLLPGSTLESVVQAVRSVARGGTAIDPVVAAKMLQSLNGETLTCRELEVLRLLMEGLGNKVIAQELGIALGTAKSHVKNLLAKLNATSRTEVVAIAQRRGLLPPEIPRRRTGRRAAYPDALPMASSAQP